MVSASMLVLRDQQDTEFRHLLARNGGEFESRLLRPLQLGDRRQMRACLEQLAVEVLRSPYGQAIRKSIPRKPPSVRFFDLLRGETAVLERELAKNSQDSECPFGDRVELRGIFDRQLPFAFPRRCKFEPKRSRGYVSAVSPCQLLETSYPAFEREALWRPLRELEFGVRFPSDQRLRNAISRRRSAPLLLSQDLAHLPSRKAGNCCQNRLIYPRISESGPLRRRFDEGALSRVSKFIERHALIQEKPCQLEKKVGELIIRLNPTFQFLSSAICPSTR